MYFRNMMIDYLIKDINETYEGKHEKFIEKRIEKVKALNYSELKKLYTIIKYLHGLGGEDNE